MITPCIALREGQDLACVRGAKNKHYQLAIFYNQDYLLKSDFTDDKYRGSIFKPFLRNQNAEIDVKRIIFTAPNESNIIKGEFSKSTDSYGHSTYKHEVSILISALTEEDKRMIHALNNGIWKVVLFTINGKGELYGGNYGIKTENFRYGDDAEVIKLVSIKDEYTMPLFYDGESIGDEYVEDAFKIFDRTFDKTFE